jgi:cutinase
MKTALILAALAAFAYGSPTPREDIILDLGAMDDSEEWLDSRNDVTSGACKPVTLIFARGTTEQGNMGSLVGPPFAKALEEALPGQVAVQGVKYPANIPGYLARGDKPGGVLQGKLAMQALQKCPQTKIVLSGYR